MPNYLLSVDSELAHLLTRAQGNVPSDVIGKHALGWDKAHRSVTGGRNNSSHLSNVHLGMPQRFTVNWLVTASSRLVCGFAGKEGSKYGSHDPNRNGLHALWYGPGYL